MTTKHRIFTTSFASVYPYYVAKAEKKGRKQSEVDAIICWLTGYTQKQFEKQLKEEKDFESFFNEAPKLNPSRTLIKGVICGIRVEDVTMADIDIERRPKQSWWPWALALLLLVLVVGTTWYLAGPEGDRVRTDTETPEMNRPEPAPTPLPDQPGAPTTSPGAPGGAPPR